MKYNQTITTEGDNNNFLYIIKTGTVKLCKMYLNNSIQILELPELSVFGQEPY